MQILINFAAQNERKKQMKILIVSFYYTPEIGAAPIRITNLARGLQAKGHEVDVLTCLPNYPKGRIFEGYRHRYSCQEDIDGIHVYRYWAYATISKNPIKRLFAMSSFALTLRSFAVHRRKIRSYDRIIVQSPPILVAPSAVRLFAKRFKKTVILNVSDLWPSSAVELGAVREGSLAHRYMLSKERFIYTQSTAVMGQSEGILERVESIAPAKPLFLYRNLQFEEFNSEHLDLSRRRQGKLHIVYAGLFGVAQDMLSLIRGINFKSLGAELHLYGAGNQLVDIQKYIIDSGDDIIYHGFLPKDDVNQALADYDVSLIPLTTSIHGAVPSKTFDLLCFGIPTLFSGSGEGAMITEKYGFGLVSAPADYAALADNIRAFAAMPDEEYLRYANNCLEAAVDGFSFDKQMLRFNDFLESL